MLRQQRAHRHWLASSHPRSHSDLAHPSPSPLPAAPQDLTNAFNFIYRQRVIKPALVGLAGPWVSGGIELNWPQHHRPSTFMPCDVAVERDERDGSVTVWCSEHEPMQRMKVGGVAGWRGGRVAGCECMCAAA